MNFMKFFNDELENCLYDIQSKANYTQNHTYVRSYLGDNFGNDYRDYILHYEDEIIERINFYQQMMTRCLIK
jgi:hypothetical protein